MSPNTERKYREALKVEGLLFGCKELPDLETLRLAVESSSPPEQEISSVEQWRKAIESRVDKGAGPIAIYDYLRTEVEDFEGSLSAVKRMVRQIKKAKV